MDYLSRLSLAGLQAGGQIRPEDQARLLFGPYVSSLLIQPKVGALLPVLYAVIIISNLVILRVSVFILASIVAALLWREGKPRKRYLLSVALTGLLVVPCALLFQPTRVQVLVPVFLVLLEFVSYQRATLGVAKPWELRLWNYLVPFESPALTQKLNENLHKAQYERRRAVHPSPEEISRLTAAERESINRTRRKMEEVIGQYSGRRLQRTTRLRADAMMRTGYLFLDWQHLPSDMGKYDKGFIQNLLWAVDPGSRIKPKNMIFNGFREAGTPSLSHRKAKDNIWVSGISVTQPRQIRPAIQLLMEAMGCVTVYEKHRLQTWSDEGATEKTRKQFTFSMAVQCELRKYPPEFERGVHKKLDVDEPSEEWKRVNEQHYVQRDRHLVSVLTFGVDRYVVASFHIGHMMENPAEDTVDELSILFRSTIFNPEVIKIWLDLPMQIAALDATLDHLYRGVPTSYTRKPFTDEDGVVRIPSYKDIGPPDFFTASRPELMTFTRQGRSPFVLDFYDDEPCLMGFHSDGVDYADRVCPCGTANFEVTALLDHVLRQHAFVPSVTTYDPVARERLRLITVEKPNWSDRLYSGITLDRLERWMLAGHRLIPLLSTFKHGKTDWHLEQEQPFPRLTLDEMEIVRKDAISWNEFERWEKNTLGFERDNFALEYIYGPVISLALITRETMCAEESFLLAQRLVAYGTLDAGHILTAPPGAYESTLYRPASKYERLPIYVIAPEMELDPPIINALQYALVLDSVPFEMSREDSAKIDILVNDAIHMSPQDELGEPFNEELEAIIASCCWAGPKQHLDKTRWTEWDREVRARQVWIFLTARSAANRLGLEVSEFEFNIWHLTMFTSRLDLFAREDPILRRGEPGDCKRWMDFADCDERDMKGIADLLEYTMSNKWSSLYDRYIDRMTALNPRCVGEGGGDVLPGILKEDFVQGFRELLLHYVVLELEKLEKMDDHRALNYKLYENCDRYRSLAGHSVSKRDEVAAFLHKHGLKDETEVRYRHPYWFKRLQVLLALNWTHGMPFGKGDTLVFDELQNWGLVEADILIYPIVDACILEMSLWRQKGDLIADLDHLIACITRDAEESYKNGYLHSVHRLLGVQCNYSHFLVEILWWALFLWVLVMVALPYPRLSILVAIGLRRWRKRIHAIAPVMVDALGQLRLWTTGIIERSPETPPRTELHIHSFDPGSAAADIFAEQESTKTLLSNSDPEAEAQKTRQDTLNAVNYTPPNWIQHVFKFLEGDVPNGYEGAVRHVVAAASELLEANPGYDASQLTQFPRRLHSQAARLYDERCHEFAIPYIYMLTRYTDHLTASPGKTGESDDRTTYIRVKQRDANDIGLHGRILGAHERDLKYYQDMITPHDCDSIARERRVRRGLLRSRQLGPVKDGIEFYREEIKQAQNNSKQPRRFMMTALLDDDQKEALRREREFEREKMIETLRGKGLPVPDELLSGPAPLETFVRPEEIYNYFRGRYSPGIISLGSISDFSDDPWPSHPTVLAEDDKGSDRVSELGSRRPSPKVRFDFGKSSREPYQGFARLKYVVDRRPEAVRREDPLGKKIMAEEFKRLMEEAKNTKDSIGEGSRPSPRFWLPPGNRPGQPRHEEHMWDLDELEPQEMPEWWLEQVGDKEEDAVKGSFLPSHQRVPELAEEALLAKDAFGTKATKLMESTSGNSREPRILRESTAPENPIAPGGLVVPGEPMGPERPTVPQEAGNLLLGEELTALLPKAEPHPQSDGAREALKASPPKKVGRGEGPSQGTEFSQRSRANLPLPSLPSITGGRLWSTEAKETEDQQPAPRRSLLISRGAADTRGPGPATPTSAKISPPQQKSTRSSSSSGGENRKSSGSSKPRWTTNTKNPYPPAAPGRSRKSSKITPPKSRIEFFEES